MGDWYDIKGLNLKWHGSWADPGVVYRGVEVNSTIPEDTMWERWIHDDYDNLIPERENDEKGFCKFMKQHAREVKELIILAMNPIASRCTCNWGGIEILDIDSDYVISCENYGSSRYGFSKSRIRYNIKGDPFFIRKGKREYLSEYLKTNC